MRIPSVVVSPWVQAGKIVSEPLNGPTPSSKFEGTSSIATANRLFDVTQYLTKRHEWAATFEWLFTELDAPRTDCPETLPPLPPVDPEEVIAQGLKPLNDHLAIQVQFYCIENNLPDCPDTATMNQLEASQFISKQLESFLEKLHQ